MKPLFISIDGVDGAGKSTQIQLLVDWLSRRDMAVTQVRDPGGTELGEALRDILLHREEIPLGNRAEMLLYMASRAELVDEIISPNLQSGRAVISDRYLLANVVYQGCAGALDPETIWEVGRIATGGLFPDLTFVLDLPVDVAMSRIGGSPDRLESRGREYLEKVRQGFLAQAPQAPSGRCVIVDATQSIEQVHEIIVAEVERALKGAR